MLLRRYHNTDKQSVKQVEVEVTKESKNEQPKNTKKQTKETE